MSEQVTGDPESGLKDPESGQNEALKDDPKLDLKDTESGQKDEPESVQNRVDPPNDCYKYDDAGVMVYTDPVSKVEYVLDPSGSNWILKSAESGPEFDSGSGSKYKFDGTTYTYTDEGSGVKHRWDLEKHEWATVLEEER